MSTDIKQFLRSDVLAHLELKFENMVVRLRMKAKRREQRELSNVQRLWRASKVEVIEPEPGQIERSLYG
jgi:hypothetical protein